MEEMTEECGCQTHVSGAEYNSLSIALRLHVADEPLQALFVMERTRPLQPPWVMTDVRGIRLPKCGITAPEAFYNLAVGYLT